MNSLHLVCRWHKVNILTIRGLILCFEALKVKVCYIFLIISSVSCYCSVTTPVKPQSVHWFKTTDPSLPQL